MGTAMSDSGTTRDPQHNSDYDASDVVGFTASNELDLWPAGGPFSSLENPRTVQDVARRFFARVLGQHESRIST